jgi:hypothetical protein
VGAHERKQSGREKKYVNRKKSRQRLGADNIVVAGFYRVSASMGYEGAVCDKGRSSDCGGDAIDRSAGDPVQFPRLFISSLKENPQRM